MVDLYISELASKFPACYVDKCHLKDTTYLVVGAKKGDKWFELPLCVSDGITQQQWDSGQEIRDSFESKVSRELSRIKA